MQINVEYFFRLLYNCFHGSCYGSLTPTDFYNWLTHVWLWLTNVGYVLSVVGLFVIIYVLMRLFDLRKREKEFYTTVISEAGEDVSVKNPRWKHIESLANSTEASQWREAIIEADIMLDDVLTRRGYEGDGVGEKLKNVGTDMKSVQDAWEAHKVRNQIAHEGSSFNISETIAHRTISRYEAVFKEFKVI